MASGFSRTSFDWEEIRPPKMNWDGVRLPILSALNDAADHTLVLFNRTTEYWKSNRPKFEKRVETNRGDDTMGFVVQTSNVIYGYLDKGTEGKTYIPVDMYRLKPGKENLRSGIPGVYNAGSIPGTLAVKGSSGKDWSSDYFSLNMEVNWPGVRKRDFSGLIREELTDTYDMKRRIQTAMNKGAEIMIRKAGKSNG